MANVALNSIAATYGGANLNEIFYEPVFRSDDLMRNYRVIPNVKHKMNVYTSAALTKIVEPYTTCSSGNETGGLYFEPHEKTYISLNNPTELLVNSFDVDIVYENETLCTALSGKTIVCFHIREKR